MPNIKNTESLAEIKDNLDDFSAMWVVDYRGLTVKEIQQLRKDIRESGATMKVYKNTLMKIAIQDLDLPDMKEALCGPSAFVISREDPVAAAKAINEFSKSNDALEIKGGIMDGEFVDVEGVKAVAELPSRDQIYAMFAGAVSGVARGLAVSINGVGRGLAQTISQIADKDDQAA